MKTYISLIAGLMALTACQSAPKPELTYDYQSLLIAEPGFAGDITPVETEQQIYALPEQVQSELQRILHATSGITERSKTLLRYIFTFAHDELIYDNSATKTASETLAIGKANCLSLSILAYSMANEVGLKTVFQDVAIPEYWTSEQNTTWLNGHVNLRIVQNTLPENHSGVILFGRDIVVDFDPTILKQRFSTTQLNKQRVTAMFYNNKAAEQLNSSEDAQAYQYYLAAIDIDPTFAVTWANLGVLYRKYGLDQYAEQAYQHSLKLDPTSLNTMSNLAYLYHRSDRQHEAEQLMQHVNQARKNNPYYYLMLGNEALRRNDTAEAISQYEHAVRLDRNNHEAYFGLAKAYFQLNDTVQAERYLQRAKRTAPSDQDKEQYQRKLTSLLQVASVH
ncbi:tetratricopeptide repeat protein [Rheinheimera muenzenbergensis]|uniref:Tetratricopeptide repeat protein n=1 Tax=Rheinheimera muenzenbergensis TaxID=1193628 RepID=A0ABU8CBU7_9GAMM